MKETEVGGSPGGPSAGTLQSRVNVDDDNYKEKVKSSSTLD